jgi:hypothetical protein
MNSYQLYSRLCKLECSNNNLILLYNYLSKQADDERKEICLIRLKKRNKIKSELRESIRKIRNDKGLWAKKVFICFISFVMERESSLGRFYRRNNWKKASGYEVKNLKLYYTALYTKEAPKPFIDMFLKHKNSIEGYLNIRSEHF